MILKMTLKIARFGINKGAKKAPKAAPGKQDWSRLASQIALGPPPTPPTTRLRARARPNPKIFPKWKPATSKMQPK